MLINARPNDSSAEIGSSKFATMQMAQEVSKTHRAVFDRSASETDAALLQVRIEIGNREVAEAFLVCT